MSGALAAVAALAAVLVASLWMVRCEFVECVDCPDGDCPPDDDGTPPPPDRTSAQGRTSPTVPEPDEPVGEPELEADLRRLFDTWRAMNPGQVHIAHTDEMLEQEAQVWENHGYHGLAARLRARQTGR